MVLWRGVGTRGFEPQVRVFLRLEGVSLGGRVTKEGASLKSVQYDYPPALSVYDSVWKNEMEETRTSKTTFNGVPSYQFVVKEKTPAPLTGNRSLDSDIANTETYFYFDRRTHLPLGYGVKGPGYPEDSSYDRTVVLNTDPKSWSLSKETAIRMARAWLAADGGVDLHGTAKVKPHN